MSNHNAPQHRSDSQAFTKEQAALDSDFEDFKIPTHSKHSAGNHVAGKHEQKNTTNPKNFAAAIIERLQAEEAASAGRHRAPESTENTENQSYSIEDSYKQTLDGLNSTVNENLSLDEQYANTMAAFDKIPSVYESPIENTQPVEPAEATETAQPVETDETSKEDVEKMIKKISDVNNGTTKNAESQNEDTENESDRKFSAPSPFDLGITKVIEKVEQNETEGPSKEAVENWINQIHNVISGPTKGEKSSQSAPDDTKHASNKESDLYNLTSADIAELKKLDTGSYGTKEGFTDEEWHERRLALDEKHLEFDKRKNQTASTERKGFWKRNVTERLANAKAAKANKADRVSRRSRLKESFMGISGKEVLDTVINSDRKLFGYIARKWSATKTSKAIQFNKTQN